MPFCFLRVANLFARWQFFVSVSCTGKQATLPTSNWFCGRERASSGPHSGERGSNADGRPTLVPCAVQCHRPRALLRTCDSLNGNGRKTGTESNCSVCTIAIHHRRISRKIILHIWKSKWKRIPVCCLPIPSCMSILWRYATVYKCKTLPHAAQRKTAISLTRTWLPALWWCAVCGA